MKLKPKPYWQGVSKPYWQGVLMIICVAAIFIGGYYFRAWHMENLDYRISKVYSQEVTTSAITDRNELQLTDRETGQVRIYDKEILDAIFYQYLARKTYVKKGGSE
ncbi:hypothetical protein LCGC14_2476670 [marine sediment metagenome]|uniref:Uncharacterized protein n=1 Tax=marine sediment metagenome TaxID=412755 RepID=A0A0F9B8Q6_9ZZZZ